MRERVPIVWLSGERFKFNRWWGSCQPPCASSNIGHGNQSVTDIIHLHVIHVNSTHIHRSKLLQINSSVCIDGCKVQLITVLLRQSIHTTMIGRCQKNHRSNCVCPATVHHIFWVFVPQVDGSPNWHPMQVLRAF